MTIPKSWRNGFTVAKAASLLSNATTNSKRMGAALYSGNKLVSIGHNIYRKTHPVYIDNNSIDGDFCRNVHAELMAISRRKHYDNRNLIIYVYRELNNGSPGCSRPCKFCRKIIEEFGINRIRFINESSEYSEEKV